MKAQEFYNERMKKGQTYHITSNDEPDYSLPFYQSIFGLMEEYAESQLKERDEEIAHYKNYAKHTEFCTFLLFGNGKCNCGLIPK